MVSKKLKFLSASLLMTSAISSVALSAEHDQARQDMREASEYARKNKDSRFASLRLEASQETVAAKLALERQELKVGEQWWVAATLPVANQALKSSRGSNQKKKYLRHYHFKVIDVADGLTTIEIKPNDQDRAVQVRFNKQRRLVDAQGATLIGGISQFPISIPAFNDAEAKQVTLDSGEEAVQFVSEDALSRPVEVIWKKSDPWPLSMKSAAGTAVLLKEAPAND